MSDYDFTARATAGDAIGTLRLAVVNGALWAIGLAWANGIREVTRAILPDDTLDIVLAEALVELHPQHRLA